MSIFRRRESARQPEPTPRKKLETLVRGYPVPKELTLDGFVDDLSPTEALARSRGFPPEKILEDAYGIYLKAFDILRRGSAEQRGAVRGCTMEMLVLVSQQALDVHKRIDAHAKETEVRNDAVGSPQAKYDADVARAVALREQARRVLAGAMRDDAAAQQEIRRAALAADAGGSVSAAMRALAELGRRILAEGDDRAQQRAALLGLDEAYLDSLDELGSALVCAEADIAKGIEASKRRHQEILIDAGLTLHLMMQVIEAFTIAHQIDRTVPLLRPVFTNRVVRRLSKLPPPPPPRGSSPRPASASSDSKKIPIDDTFRGGFGRTPRK